MKKNNCYIHIPFCSSKCKYCRFASFWITQDLQIQNYVTFLCKEIKENNFLEKQELQTIYFWWGTPWVLKISQFENIFKILREKFIFSQNIEISIETTPENVTKENIIWWKNLWINRISMWVQTLNEKSLEEIWRADKWSIIEALENVLKIWFDNFSIDFIIGLPFVEKWEINKNIDFLLQKYDFIKHISVYMLEEYFDIPEEKESSFDNITYPDSWSKTWLWEKYFLEEYLSVKNNLNEKWFNFYELSNSSKPGYECKHNIWYWNHTPTFAFWLGAHGFLDNTRFSNSESFLEYYAKKNIKKDKVTSEDKFIEKMMFLLRTNWIDKKYTKKLDTKKINYFIENNYLVMQDNKIILWEKWIVFMDYILWEIL